ncbi:MAG: AAA family ATPase [delta proteobacterium MLS_D]|jgi:ATP-dependent DNA helicase PIF1|nr:MAG: AAA family ATPase [delta proteobacterium MLS_D]
MVRRTGIPKDIDLNPQFRRALELMEDSDRHVFVTGRAGTGKSTLLQYFRFYTKKKVVILAPTGVAAVNVGGQTIHSFFHFKPNVTPSSIRKKKRSDEDKPTVYKKLEAVVIDEVSMVRADLLDCVDRFLRYNGPDEKLPFGGVRMIFIGDLYQLPPVVTGREREIFREHYESPYFFSARAFQGLDLEFVELERVYRQKDGEFLRLLNGIRNRTVTDEDLAILNSRCDPAFEPPEDDFYIALTGINKTADEINEGRLARLPGRTWTACGYVEGKFEKEYLPTAEELKLKEGAQIMLLNNDSYGRWINGTIGKVTGFEDDGEGGEVINASLDNGFEVEIAPYTWEIYRYFLKGKELASEPVGSFIQYPVRLAFAVTIHKSQGKTFERVFIDVGRGTFAHGQMYVALSRCVSLEGIVLKQPVRKSHILMDWKIVRFLTGLQYEKAEKQCSRDEKLALIRDAIGGGKDLDILYLKAKDEKSRRRVRPLAVGDRSYNGHPFLGMTAWCRMRGGERMFNVDRILEITRVDEEGEGS